MLHIQKEEISQFRSFQVPNALVDQFLSDANPAHIAVYLYSLRQAYSGNCDLSNANIASALNVDETVVVNAFLYFASKGLVQIPNFTGMEHTDFDVKFCFDAPSVAAHEPQRRPSYQRTEIARHLEENPKLAQMYHVVRDLLGKNLGSSDINILYSLYDWYGLPVEVILVLVEHCVSKGKKGMKRIEAEAGKWADAGIDTVCKAQEYIQQQEAFLSYANQVLQAIGLTSRKPSAKELAYMRTWNEEYHMDIPMVEAAYERTVNHTGKLSFAYMNTILASWHAQGIQHPTDLTRDVRPAPKRETAYQGLEDKLMERRVLGKGGNMHGI